MSSHLEKESKTNKIGLVAAASIAVAVLFGGGFAVGIANKPAPEVITKTETKTVTEYKTPQACFDYIEATELSYTYFGEIIDISGNAITAASTGNLVGLDRATADMKAVNEKLTTLKPILLTAKADCAATK